MMHVNIIIAVEAAFKIRFDAKEINAPENVGQLADLVENKLRSK
jgi:acyl carrier protein